FFFFFFSLFGVRCIIFCQYLGSATFGAGKKKAVCITITRNSRFYFEIQTRFWFGACAIMTRFFFFFFFPAPKVADPRYWQKKIQRTPKREKKKKKKKKKKLKKKKIKKLDIWQSLTSIQEAKSNILGK
ncbi:MAG: hypothetical protein O7C56_00275, partial [Rickettsia endosymbiont of Ixodes persulcatus]|nr:hypothetical protein [Rickettsia endosymbiont of Ixodes persulcatus]